MKKLTELATQCTSIQISLTLLAYGFYATIIGISITPSVYLLSAGSKRFLSIADLPGVFLFSLCSALSLFVYFFFGTVIMAGSIRLLSHGIGPGRYPIQSGTMIRWLTYNGLYNIAGKTILANVPMGFLNTLFFRIVGAKIGKNVAINSWYLNDAYLLEIGDNVVIGGKTDISCHTFEQNHLVLLPIKIGANSLIGQRCYISPGVTIGCNCVIGQYALIRKNSNIPHHSVLSSVGGLPIRTIAKIERAARI